MKRTRFFPAGMAISLFSILVAFAACGGNGGNGIVNPVDVTIRITNGTNGKILEFRIRDCGLADWGPDQLDPFDPVTGVIEVGASRDFTERKFASGAVRSIAGGCYDLQVQHLTAPEGGPKNTQELLGRNVGSGGTLQWTVPPAFQQPE